MNERLRQVMEYLKEKRLIYNQREFVVRLEANPSAVSEMIGGKRNVSNKFIDRIGLTFRMINTQWMRTGDGDMILADYAPEIPEKYKERIQLENELLKNEIEKYKEKITEMSERIGALKYQLNGNPPK